MDQVDLIVPSKDRIKEDVQHLKDWMLKEPHLPKIDDEEWLETFLFNNKFSLEKTKYKLDNYYTMRNVYPDILKNCDPTSPEILQARKAVNVVLSDRLTEDGSLILYHKFNTDSKILDIVQFTKRSFMLTDLLIIEFKRLANMISIVDCKDINAQHIFKVGLGMGAMSDILDKAYTERTKAIHLINAPNTVHVMTDLLRKFLSKKTGDRIFTHPTRSRTIFDAVDENIFCSDFGGKGPSFAELDDYTQNLLEKHRQWFKEQEDICSNELLRRKDSNQPEEMKGSFRKLEVD